MKRLVVSLPDEHYTWLEELAKVKGVETVQDAARTVIADAYERNKKRIKEEKYE